MSYNNYQLDQNRHTSHTAQAALRQASVLAGDAVKFFIDFVSSMVRMFLGK